MGLDPAAMLSAAPGMPEDSSTHGMTPRVVHCVFNALAAAAASGGASPQLAVSVSLLEIYNEDVRDLLAPPGSAGVPATPSSATKVRSCQALTPRAGWRPASCGGA